MKNSRIFFIVLLCLACSTISTAQIKVATNNNVGVGIETPNSQLSVNGSGDSRYTLYSENTNLLDNTMAGYFKKSVSGGSQYSYGLFGINMVNGGSRIVGAAFQAYTGTPISSKRTIAVRGYAGNATSGYNYAVYGGLLGSNNGTAIFATIPGRGECYINNIYAGYFRGNVFIEDDLWVDAVHYNSDMNLKKEVRPLATVNSPQIDKIKSLTSIKYKLKNPAELNLSRPAESDTLSTPLTSLVYDSDKYTKDKIGLSAQEVQVVYPELVKEDGDGFLSVDYIGLIPVLIEGMKEQQAIIEELQTELIKIQAEVDKPELVPIK